MKTRDFQWNDSKTLRKGLKILFSKKAQEYTLGPHKTLFYAVFSIFVTVMIITLVMVVFNDRKDIAELPENLEIDLIKFRVINSYCFLKQEKNTNRFLNMIDWNKFNQNTIDSCIISDKKDSPQYRLTLTPLKKYNGATLKEIEKPLNKKKIKTRHFIGSSKSITSYEYIFIDNKIYWGKLKIEAE